MYTYLFVYLCPVDGFISLELVIYGCCLVSFVTYTWISKG